MPTADVPLLSHLVIVYSFDLVGMLCLRDTLARVYTSPSTSLGSQATTLHLQVGPKGAFMFIPHLDMP